MSEKEIRRPSKVQKQRIAELLHPFWTYLHECGEAEFDTEYVMDARFTLTHEKTMIKFIVINKAPKGN